MIDLLNVPNPDEKIKMIVNEAILKKRAEVEKATNELEDLNRQSENGIYYSRTDATTGSSSALTYVTMAVLSIIKDVLHGFQAATKYMKDTAIAVETERNGRNGRNDSQIGGNARGYTDTDSIKKQADVLGPNLNLTHQQIASDINSSREVVSRLLKKLESNGTVEVERNNIKWRGN